MYGVVSAGVWEVGGSGWWGRGRRYGCVVEGDGGKRDVDRVEGRRGQMG